MSDNIFSKKCDVCGIQPAMLFFKTFNESSVHEEGLCPQCALKRFSEGGNINIAENRDILNTINHMRHILTDIIGHISKVERKTPIEKCKICGTTSTNIKHDKKAGCGACYTEFDKPIRTAIKKSAFSSKHQGQVPNRHRHIYLKNLELEKLHIKLQEHLRTENYEEAAKIKKRISKLK